MACEYISDQLQTVALNTPIIFSDSIPCRRGLIYHEDGTGVFQLRGCNNGGCCCCGIKTTDYQVTFNGNIAVPEGGTVGPIAIALAVAGEPIDSSRAIFTPAAVDEYGNVTATKIVKVPWKCCPSLSVEYVNGSVDDPTFVPTPVINVVNANLTITPVQN
jgi:hypothetical protein